MSETNKDTPKNVADASARQAAGGGAKAAQTSKDTPKNVADASARQAQAAGSAKASDTGKDAAKTTARPTKGSRNVVQQWTEAAHQAQQATLDEWQAGFRAAMQYSGLAGAAEQQ